MACESLCSINHLFAYCVFCFSFAGMACILLVSCVNTDAFLSDWLTIFCSPVAIMCVVGVACLGTVMVRLTKTIKVDQIL